MSKQLATSFEDYPAKKDNNSGTKQKAWSTSCSSTSVPPPLPADYSKSMDSRWLRASDSVNIKPIFGSISALSSKRIYVKHKSVLARTTSEPDLLPTDHLSTSASGTTTIRLDKHLKEADYNNKEIIFLLSEIRVVPELFFPKQLLADGL